MEYSLFKNNKNKKYSNKGFTLIELLVVVAIIGILSSVVLASLKTAREKARDAQRISDIKQIQNAIEMYYNDNGFYPKITAHTETDSGCGGSINWCGATGSLKFYLSPYLSKLPLRDDAGFYKAYYYESNAGDNYQTYGFMASLESSSNSSRESGDGGYLGHMYEVGQQPKYCMEKYTGSSAYWWSAPNVCVGGN